jgi:phosphatidylglycerophosphatase A
MRDEERLAERLATWFGCGRSPVAPGTVGSLGAVPLHFALRLLPPLPHAAAIVAITAVGLWASEREAQRLGEEDPQSVVIDEVAGTLIAMAMTRRLGLSAQLLALALFRAYDIIKPGPIDSVQHVEPAGLGIMADDVLAGVMAGLTARWLVRR